MAVTGREEATATSSIWETTKDRSRSITVPGSTMELSELTDKADVNFLREGVLILAPALVEPEVATHAGANPGECAPEQRSANATATGGRWGTRAGTVELPVPKFRSGPSYFPSFRGRADGRSGRSARSPPGPMWRACRSVRSKTSSIPALYSG